MSNGWYQLENSRPRKVPPYIPAAGPHRREPYVPVTVPASAPAPEPKPPALPEEPSPQEPPALKWERTDTPPEPAQTEEPHPLRTTAPQAPSPLPDGALHETLNAFVYEKPLERAVHAKGWGAMGYFECTHPMGAFTMLPFLQRPGQRTPTATRFSLAVSSRDTPDASRNVRGFSTKFYAESGVFDLLCNHLPVFSVRDPIRFPESIHALLPSPVSNLSDPSRFWAFAARAPETTHFLTWLYSDAGTLKSLRRLRAYGVNTYVWRNAAGERRYVKYHWVPLAGTEFITAEESAALAGDPEVAGRDLYTAIAQGEYPQYELKVQLMDPAEGERLPYDPLDCTKVWDVADYPLQPVGRLTLDKNPEDYWEQVEKLAFSPANLLPGAELSGDRLLQGRALVYWDAQRRRLGPDFRKLPVNRQTDWTPDRLTSRGLETEVSRLPAREDQPRQDDFAQAGECYRAFSPEEREHLAANIAKELKGADETVRSTVLGYLRRADEDYFRQVAERIQ